MDAMEYAQRFTAQVGRELKGAILAQGWSIGGVADTLGIERSTLSRYLNGKRDMPTSVLIAAGRVIGVPARTILDRAADRLSDAQDDGRAQVQPSGDDPDV